MVTDAQVRPLRKKFKDRKLVPAAAAAAGMSERGAHNWKDGPLPSHRKKDRREAHACRVSKRARRKRRVRTLCAGPGARLASHRAIVVPGGHVEGAMPANFLNYFHAALLTNLALPLHRTGARKKLHSCSSPLVF